jgi:hypothetical protein
VEKMNQRKAYWMAGAFAICFFAEAPFWLTGTYTEYLKRSPSWWTIALPAVMALYLSWIVRVEIILTAFAVGAAVPTIIVVRIIMDCAQDPTHHNLWPFELGLMTVCSMAITFTSAGIGWLLRRITHRRPPAR